jgi:hypothetical protein
MYYVRLTTMMGLLDVTHSWLSGLYGRRIMDDARDNPAKGSPHIMHQQEIFQALLAKRMRDARIGYDTIRLGLDRLEFDKKPKVTFQVAKGVDFTIHRREIMQEASELLATANRLEYGSEEQEAA